MLVDIRIPDGEWERRSSLERPEAEALADPIWRLANLYQIRDEQGRYHPFTPRLEQRKIIWAIHVLGWRALIIPKARKLGVSTVLGVIAADKLAWESGVEIALVDLTQEDAEKKLNGITKVALDGMPRELRAAFVTPRGGKANQSTITIAAAAGEDKPSVMEAGVTFRGATPQLLWVSEWGAIQHDDPGRSTEIKTGAMEAARWGIRVIETTWKGGKAGDVWPYVQEALETPEESKELDDWRLLFLPWYIDPRNTRQGRAEHIPPKVAKYLADKEKELGLTFTEGQRLWYAKRAGELGIFMTRENPTTLDECWRSPVEGAIYADLLDQRRAAGAITAYEWSRAHPVFTLWDLGWNDMVAVWAIQFVGRDPHLIRYTAQRGQTAAQMAVFLRGWDIPFAGHYLPHDGGSVNDRGAVGTTYKAELEKAGLFNVIVVPRIPDLWIGINYTRDLIARASFCLPHVQEGLDALEAYHTPKASTGGAIKKDPVHDWSSHGSSALRTGAEAVELGLINPNVVRKYENAHPRFPDGSTVDPEAVMAVRARRRGATALSGHSPL